MAAVDMVGEGGCIHHYESHIYVLMIVLFFVFLLYCTLRPMERWEAVAW